MVMEIRTIDEIKDALMLSQMSRHPYLRDYTDYSVLSTINESMAIQIQYVEEMAKATIEANSIWNATGDDLDLLVVDRGIERQEGIRATGTLTFYTSTPATSTITIPLGTIVSGTGLDGTRLFFETTVAGTIAIGYTSTVIAAQGQGTGTDYNVPEHSVNTMSVYISGISRVDNVAAFSGGTDEESDDDLRERYKYATDINGKATLPLMEQHIFDLDTVRECQVYTKAAGEIEIVVDTSVTSDDDDDVMDCIEENIAAGIVARGKPLGTITTGVFAATGYVIEIGRLAVRVESNLIATDETFDISYTNINGVAKTASVTIPGGSTKGDTINAVMSPTTDFAEVVTGTTYVGGNSYTILGGMGEYPYFYILPKFILTNVLITVVQTTTPDPDLDNKIQDSVEAYLDAFYIGDDLEFSDLIPYIYMDYETKDTTRDQFVGIDQISSVTISANGSAMTGFGQTIAIASDERVEPGTITVTLV